MSLLSGGELPESLVSPVASLISGVLSVLNSSSWNEGKEEGDEKWRGSRWPLNRAWPGECILYATFFPVPWAQQFNVPNPGFFPHTSPPSGEGQVAQAGDRYG